MKMIFLFIDGFGLGKCDKSKNPVYAAKTPNFDYIFNSFNVMPTDCSLGIPGLPQSATGQTAIFTGVNAPAVLGRHMNGQPTVTLKEIINRNNVFKELKSRGFKVTNANAYRQEYLDRMHDPKERRYRPSVTSVMTMSAGLNFRLLEDFNQGNAVYHDITGQILLEYGLDVNIITPEEAAGRLYNISRGYDFTLFEHFMPDIIGHKMDMELAVKEIELLDEFIGHLIKRADFDKDIIFITSDHGNIEDVSVKTHTMNKVPTIVMGRVPQGIEVNVDSLLDIMPAVLKIFQAPGDKARS